LCRRNIAQSGQIDRFGLEKLRGLLLFALVRSNDDGRLIFDEFLSFARDFRLFGRSFVCRNPFPIPHLIPHAEKKKNKNPQYDA
jgi:hypothetical protein